MFVQARSVLLDALIALEAHRESVVVVGAQDSDLGIDVRTLGDAPPIEEAMSGAGFYQDPLAGQPGSWLSPGGIPVDLMVPEAIAGRGRRSVQAPPHDKRALRRAVGLEAAVVDNAIMAIHALAGNDDRVIQARVAGPALLVAKLHKLGERQQTSNRLVDKDAYDVYRLLLTIPTDELATATAHLLADELAGDVTRSALTFLAQLFGTADGIGSVMAARTEELVGDPAMVAAACAALASVPLAAANR